MESEADKGLMLILSFIALHIQLHLLPKEAGQEKHM